MISGIFLDLTSVFFFFRFQASFTPFLTEHTYQSLRPYIPESMKSGETESIHYLMIPQARYLRLCFCCCNIICSSSLIRTASEVSMYLLPTNAAVKMNCNSSGVSLTRPGEDILKLSRAVYLHCADTVASSMLYGNPAT